MNKKHNSEEREALSFRFKVPVVEIFLMSDGYGYPLCPRCKNIVEREYIRFCSNCGQRLGWSKLYKAQVLS